jgi:uncharacterized repeat protein (TIGR01451 family)
LVHVPGSVPPSPDPYVNTAVASLNEQPYQAQAGLLVALGEASVTKTAAPTSVKPGESVTYTVTFSNSVYTPLPLAVVTDALPSGVTFITMTAGSDVSAPPNGTTGTITWTGPLTIPAHSALVVQYQTTMPMSEHLALVNQASARLEDGATIGPDSAQVRVATSHPTTLYLPLVLRKFRLPEFTVPMNAHPVEAIAQAPGALITYAITFDSLGTVPGKLAKVEDTLRRALPSSPFCPAATWRRHRPAPPARSCGTAPSPWPGKAR